MGPVGIPPFDFIRGWAGAVKWLRLVVPLGIWRSQVSLHLLGNFTPSHYTESNNYKGLRGCMCRITLRCKIDTLTTGMNRGFEELARVMH